MLKKLFLSFMIFIIVITFSTLLFADDNINISISSEGNIVKIMNDIVISEEQVITGDVVAIMGDIKVDGRVNGNVVAILGDIKINNYVGGDLVSVLGKLNLGEKAEIGGETTMVNIGDFNLKISPRFINIWGKSFRFFNLLLLYALVLLVMSLMPTQISNMSVALKKEPFRKLLIGVISLIALPILILFTIISILGIPFIPFIILFFILAKFIGYVVIVSFLADKIEALGSNNINIYLKLFLTVTILWLLNSVPLLGGIVYFLVMILALGVIIDTKFGTNRPWVKKQQKNEE